jgi:hypothetical protein
MSSNCKFFVLERSGNLSIRNSTVKPSGRGQISESIFTLNDGSAEFINVKFLDFESYCLISCSNVTSIYINNSLVDNVNTWQDNSRATFININGNMGDIYINKTNFTRVTMNKYLMSFVGVTPWKSECVICYCNFINLKSAGNLVFCSQLLLLNLTRCMFIDIKFVFTELLFQIFDRVLEMEG